MTEQQGDASLSELLSAAHQQHLARQLDAAETLYRTLLGAPSPHAAASYGLGLLCFNRGQFGEAAEAFRRTIAIRADDADAICNLATSLLAMGEPGEAEVQYRQAIAVRPGHTLAHANLGKVLQDRGDLTGAVVAYRHAIALNPREGMAHANLGGALLRQEMFAEAAAASEQAVILRPDMVMAHANLATAMLRLDRHEEALTACRRAMELQPAEATMCATLGGVLFGVGAFEDSAAAYRRAIAQNPLDAFSHLNLGGVLLQLGRFAEAAVACEQAIVLRADLAMAHANLANAMFQLKRHADALVACRRAMELEPEDAATCVTLGGILLEAGTLREAEAACRRAIALNPTMTMAHFNLAHACRAANRPEEAVAACRRAVALEPDHAGCHYLLAHMLLLQGDFDAGWDEYEWRWRLPAFSWLADFAKEVGQSRWAGEDLAGGTILLLPEQGLGDIILFIRYAPLLTERGAKVIIASRPPTLRLLASIASVTVVPIEQRPLPAFDFYCPVSSLPRLLGKRPPITATTVPYLRADPALRLVWRQRFGAARLRVGIVWGGNPETTYDRLRSPRLAPLLPLFKIPGVIFVVLQIGPAREDLTATPLPPYVIDLGPELDDLATTAAIMAEVDLVISSCTAPLHLAGALGVAAWALLPFAPYFPWRLDRSDCDWYPALRLYRQQRPGTDWSDVVAKVSDDLARFAGSYGRSAA